MLSRVAENLYWLARNIERAENLARVVEVNTNLHFDLPSGVAPGWRPLVEVTGANEAFEATYSEYNERSVVRFLLGQRNSPSSIRGNIDNARQVCRTVRDILPREAWEYLTELHLYLEEHLDEGLTQRGRYAFLSRIIRGCQMTMGLLGSVMTRDVGYQFLRMGRNIERADMTTRFIDMRPLIPVTDRLPAQAALENIQWVNVLGALSAYQMYRRKLQPQVQREHALWFLFHDDECPRSILHCLNAVEESLGALNNNRSCLYAIRKTVRQVESINTQQISDKALAQSVDTLQRGLMEIHRNIAETYFLPAES